jgi:hypothetical protein
MDAAVQLAACFSRPSDYLMLISRANAQPPATPVFMLPPAIVAAERARAEYLRKEPCRFD